MPPAKIMILPSFEAWMPKNWPPDCECVARSLVAMSNARDGVGLLDRDVDAAEPGPVHADVGDEVAAGVGDRDVHGLSDLRGLLLRRGDDPSCVLKRDHRESSFNLVHSTRKAAAGEPSGCEARSISRRIRSFASCNRPHSCRRRSRRPCSSRRCSRPVARSSGQAVHRRNGHSPRRDDRAAALARVLTLLRSVSPPTLPGAGGSGPEAAIVGRAATRSTCRPKEPAS